MTQFGQSLLSEIAATFNKRIKGDRKLKTIANRVRDGTSYEVANEYSVRVGEIMSESILEHTENLAYMSKEVAEEVIPPVMTAGHELVSEAAAIIQTNMNAADGVGLGVLTPDLDTNRIAGIVEKVASYDRFSEAEWVLKEPMINYSQAIVDQAIRKNAESSAKVGIKSYVRRTSENGACKWCEALEGVYEYPDVPRDVYRRHAFCRCRLTFERGKFRQNVWKHSETWTEKEADEQKKEVKKELTAKEIKAEKEKKRMEYERILRDDIGFSNVDQNVLKKVDPDLLDANIDRLKNLEDKFNIIHMSINPSFRYDGRKDYIAYVQRTRLNSADQDLFVCGKWYKDAAKLIEQEIQASNTGWSMPIDITNEYELKTYSITHEYGHMIHNYLYSQLQLQSKPDSFRSWMGAPQSFNQFVSNCRKEIIEIAKKQNPGVNVFDKISEYGMKNSNEFFAEVFANSQGSTPNELGKAMQTWLERQGFG